MICAIATAHTIFEKNRIMIIYRISYGRFPTLSSRNSTNRSLGTRLVNWRARLCELALFSFREHCRDPIGYCLTSFKFGPRTQKTSLVFDEAQCATHMQHSTLFSEQYCLLLLLLLLLCFFRLKISARAERIKI